MTESKNLRKKKFVSRTIQGRAVAHLAVYWGIYHVVLWHAMFLYQYVHYRGELLAGGTPVSFSELYGTFLLQHYSLIVCAVAVFPIIFWDMIKFTHRVAGPLVRFQNTLQQLTDGERVDRIQLRKGDLLIELQDVFNRYLESLRTPDAVAVDAAFAGDDYGPLMHDLRDVQQTVGDLAIDETEMEIPAAAEAARAADRKPDMPTKAATAGVALPDHVEHDYESGI